MALLVGADFTLSEIGAGVEWRNMCRTDHNACDALNVISEQNVAHRPWVCPVLCETAQVNACFNSSLLAMFVCM